MQRSRAINIHYSHQDSSPRAKTQHKITTMLFLNMTSLGTLLLVQQYQNDPQCAMLLGTCVFLPVIKIHYPIYEINKQTNTSSCSVHSICRSNSFLLKYFPVSLLHATRRKLFTWPACPRNMIMVDDAKAETHQIAGYIWRLFEQPTIINEEYVWCFPATGRLYVAVANRMS